MSIGDRIKQRRKELDLSVDDVANKLNKNRATIYRYESNDIENLPITVLEPLAKVLNTTPVYLLGLENQKPNTALTNLETKLLENFNKLNDLGKNKLVEYSNDLTETPKYITTDLTTATKENSSLEDTYTTLAAHDDDLTEYEKQNVDLRIIEALKKRQK